MKVIALMLVMLSLFAVGVACSPEPFVAVMERRSERARGVDPCMLEYNTALVTRGSETCCRREGQPNGCDPKKDCGAGGMGCCVIYSTVNAPGGQGCCLYQGADPTFVGNGGAQSEECKTLMAN